MPEDLTPFVRLALQIMRNAHLAEEPVEQALARELRHVYEENAALRTRVDELEQRLVDEDTFRLAKGELREPRWDDEEPLGLTRGEDD
jgi:hypothetical protein